MSAIDSVEITRRRNAGAQILQAHESGERPLANFAVLSTFNLDLFPPFLAEALGRIGRGVEVYMGPFGQLEQVILAPNSELVERHVRHVLIVPAAADLLAPLFERPAQFSAAKAAQLVDMQVARIQNLLVALRERIPEATVYLCVLPSSDRPTSYVLNGGSASHSASAVQWLDRAVTELSGQSDHLVIIDWTYQSRHIAQTALEDPRLWYLGRMRLNQSGLAVLADAVAESLAAREGKPKKVVAVDMDDTLWGGIVGEAGWAGITLGDDGIGMAFRDFQRELLKLHDAGVLIVIVSKNNLQDADEVLERQPSMVLRPEHIVAKRVNWQDKASNLRELAEELNLGLDSFVFLDDNPVERAWIRAALPEVEVPELPPDPVDRPSFLRGLTSLRRYSITSADVGRAASYKAQAVRSQLQRASSSVDDFIASLEQTVVVEPVGLGTLARAAQLCQRTNQFNLTTRRYTLAELESLLADPEVEMRVLAVRDRFGDSGVTGFSLVRYTAQTAEIDTLLLSCRVLGRRVEDAFLHALAKAARSRGATTLVGRFTPTAKNAQVADFYPERGFLGNDAAGYAIRLADDVLAPPSQMTIHIVNAS